jgi:DNA-binding MarR family transcriptional regulator
VVGLASRSGQLKGTVSKHVQRLVGAGLVVCVPIPGNRKEIELALTDDGKRVVDAHQQLHDEMDLGVHDFLQAYGNGDLQVVANVLRDLLAARKEGVRIARH